MSYKKSAPLSELASTLKMILVTLIDCTIGHFLTDGLKTNLKYGSFFQQGLNLYVMFSVFRHFSILSPG